MKIKIFSFMLLVALSFVSCSKDGSRTIQLDECVPYSLHNLDECKKTSELFSIVPGEYTITWKVRDELPQMTNLDGTMVIRLRLNKKLSVKEEWIKKCNSDDLPHFMMVDADGKILEGVNWGFAFEWGKENFTNKDQFMDVVKFLQSEPGTEMDVPLGSALVQCSGEKYMRSIDAIKNAKGIIMYVSKDKYFEEDVAEILN